MSFNLASTAEILRALGSRLRTQRLAQGLPQRELAQMAGLSLGALRKLEGSGQSSLETLIRVTQAWDSWMSWGSVRAQAPIHRPDGAGGIRRATATAPRRSKA